MSSLENWWFIDIDSCTNWYCFLGAIAKLPKRLLASSCLPVRMEQLGSTGRIFIKFYIVVFFGNQSK